MLHNKRRFPCSAVFPTFSRFALTQPFLSYILKDTALFAADRAARLYPCKEKEEMP